jgi:hypothetical protein
VSQPGSTAGARFKISTFSGGGDCIEVGQLGDGSIAIRHSKHEPGAATLLFTGREWEAFVAGVKAGEFDSF